MNNSSLGMVRQTQDEFFSGRFETDLLNPDFVKLAESFGVDAIKVDSICDAKSAFEKAFANNEPFVIEFVTSNEENV